MTWLKLAKPYQLEQSRRRIGVSKGHIMSFVHSSKAYVQKARRGLPRRRTFSKQRSRLRQESAFQKSVSWQEILRDSLDRCAAAVMLILCTPIIALSAILVRLTSRGPGFYHQLRVGKRGSVFTLYKIRTMDHECENATGPCWSSNSDPRVTPIGWFLRAFHIDELPQLWNVVRGEMSLVGPRPERPELVLKLQMAIPGYRSRLAVRPGITGLAQVQLPKDTDFDSVARKLRYDRCYIQARSVLFDLQILIATLYYLLGLEHQSVRRLAFLPDLERQAECRGGVLATSS